MNGTTGVSGMSMSLSGIQASALSMAATASNIANANTPDFRARHLEQEALPQGGVKPEALQEEPESALTKEPKVDLADEAVNLKGDKVTYEANLQFLQIQSSMLGTAMDMQA